LKAGDLYTSLKITMMTIITDFNTLINYSCRHCLCY